MSATITSSLRLKISSILTANFADPANSLYLFVSKPSVWTNESLPDNAIDSVKFERMTRDEMISLRKISSSELSSAIPRKNWVSGKFYDIYRDNYDGTSNNGVNYDTGARIAKNNLIDTNFYVITDDYNVYKCLWNGNAVASTVKPTGQSVNSFVTADGYRWKFMYSINTSSALRFTTNAFIPVQVIGANPGTTSPSYSQYLVEQAAVNGTIEVIEPVTVGSGYTASATLPVVIAGDGTGATATATINSSGQVATINMSTLGSGYTFATATITGSNTTVATLNPIVSPIGGHGKNATKELGGVFMTVSATIGDDITGDTLTDNSYRVIGLVYNPTVFGLSTILTAPTANALKTVVLNGGITGTFAYNENLISTGTPTNRGTFVSWNPSSKALKYIRNKNNVGADFNVAQTITGQTSGATGSVTTITNPEVDIYSGDVLYLETRRPISRDSAQKEEIRITIET